MRVGETIETAIWLNGRETPALRARLENDVVLFLDELCHLGKATRGPVRWAVLRPGDHRVPAVPDHIKGPDVKLLIANADILDARSSLATPTRSFVGDLDQRDLERLRGLTRRLFARHFAGKALSDLECDDVIDMLGPDAAADAVRKSVDGETRH